MNTRTNVLPITRTEGRRVEVRDIPVKVMLSASEFIALRTVADETGASQSGLIRSWIKEKLRSHASMLCATQQDSTGEMAQE